MRMEDISAFFFFWLFIIKLQQNKNKAKYYTSKVIYKNKCESVHFI